MPELLMIQNSPDAGPRRLVGWLAAEELTMRLVRAWAEPVPREPGAAAGVLVLGGGYLPDESERAPWLPDLCRLIGAALTAETPLLGVCLGGQALAHVAGGEVRGEHGRPEYGSTPIELRVEEAAADPLFGGLPPRVRAIEHHVDAITRLPAGAVWLASSTGCPYQAFRVGPAAWGTQFHPEVGPEHVRGWSRQGAARRGFDLDTLVAEAERHDAVSAALWRGLVGRFASVVRDNDAGLRMPIT